MSITFVILCIIATARLCASNVTRFGFKTRDIRYGSSGHPFTISLYWGLSMYQCQVIPSSMPEWFMCAMSESTTTICMTTANTERYGMQISNPSNDDACVAAIKIEHDNSDEQILNFEDHYTNWIGNDYQGIHYRYYYLGSDGQSLPETITGFGVSGIPYCIADRPLVFAHYMPWFQFDPNDELQSVHWPPNSGTYYQPIIGYYSSQNETVIKWQISLMEKVGINGIIVDWYGTRDRDDYTFINEATNMIWNEIRLNYPNFKLAILYDLNSQDTNKEIFKSELEHLKTFFQDSHYLKDDDNNPILFLWPSYDSVPKTDPGTIQTPDALTVALTETELTDLKVYIEYRNPAFDFANLESPSLSDYPQLGVFNWVYPYHKDTQTVEYDVHLLFENTNAPYIQAMYIGFNDHYVNHLNFIDADDDWLHQINNILLSEYENIDLIQIPTWNDYTEGTMIEPHTPTDGCVDGYELVENNPYYYLIQLHKLFVDPNADVQKVRGELEAITTKYFSSVEEWPTLRCTGWPTSGGSHRQRCENGNLLNDGFYYAYNEGRGTSLAVCGESAGCWCCRRPKPSSMSCTGWPVGTATGSVKEQKCQQGNELYQEDGYLYFFNAGRYEYWHESRTCGSNTNCWCCRTLAPRQQVETTEPIGDYMGKYKHVLMIVISTLILINVICVVYYFIGNKNYGKDVKYMAIEIQN